MKLHTFGPIQIWPISNPLDLAHHKFTLSVASWLPLLPNCSLHTLYYEYSSLSPKASKSSSSQFPILSRGACLQTSYKGCWKKLSYVSELPSYWRCENISHIRWRFFFSILSKLSPPSLLQNSSFPTFLLPHLSSPSRLAPSYVIANTHIWLFKYKWIYEFKIK